MGSAAASANSDIVKKYQGVAPNRIINAVARASKKTGVDFAFLMEKASAESSFDPKARSKSSSARGLFQFIEDTWLSMVKRHGRKFGLGEYAEQIDIKNGRCCVDDAQMKKEILRLRDDPEISALMAGAYTAENQRYLEANTECDVGPTEMYLAHFMGAGGAAKFINCRDYDGDAVAAKLFPRQAQANKNVFYDRATKKARTLDEIYALFGKKFTGGPDSPSSSPSAPKGSTTAPAAADTASHAPALKAARALPVFDDGNEADDIIWADDPRFRHHQPSSGFGRQPRGIQRISPESILIMAQMEQNLPRAFGGPRDRHGYNS